MEKRCVNLSTASRCLGAESLWKKWGDRQGYLVYPQLPASNSPEWRLIAAGRQSFLLLAWERDKSKSKGSQVSSNGSLPLEQTSMLQIYHQHHV